MMRYRSSSVNGKFADEGRSRDPGTPVDGATLLFEVWLVSRAATDLLDAALAPAGLNADEFAIYSVLLSGESLTPTDLAKWMAAPPTTVSSYVKRFEARGHITRDRNPADGRSYFIRLTAAGANAHAKAQALFIPVLVDVLATLDRREATVRAALLSTRRALDRVREGDQVREGRRPGPTM